ncbi:LpqB family beta-propeller domain-containing protein [Intrasporangium sp.]|uniref:LpqB family beta-propeller domain-containing protein n=1 Tax=Intrasporangium sp. TaxID=1925024 RepID=UPI00293AC6CA|nr:LpqB family beta-propeller domain-containing protein [Intrasporangium sp.]MDV3220037.1 LpqB family beta-propeller domain-containing protein [Intrasporangium sp.]
MRRNVLRRVRAALAGLVVAGAVGACAGLPETSPVTEGRRLDEPINEPQIRVAAQGPVPGATPEQIVRGFIRAGEDESETHDTAKVYLSHASVDLWRWAAKETVIYNRASDLRIERTGDSTIQVSVAPVGILATNGRYHDVPPGQVIRTTFGLTQVAGEWRLELPEDGFGLWLEASAFDNLYVAAPVHYVTPSGRELVPDTRWFPKGTRLATSLARAQLEPVPPHLAGAVITGFPASTRLAVNSVPVESGHAQVNLNDAARAAGLEERRAMWAQLSATLARAFVSSISISVEGTEFELAGLGTTLSSPQEVGYGFTPAPVFDSALIRNGETFKRIDPTFIPDDLPAQDRRRDGSQSLAPDDPDEIPDGWVRLTLSRDQKQVAAIGGDLLELSIWTAKDEPLRFKPGWTGLERPVYDRYQYLWVAGEKDGTPRIWSLNTAALVPPPEPAPVEVPWLGEDDVVALTISADGTRALVITEDAETRATQLSVSGVVRAPNGQPTALAEPLRQAQPLATMQDVTWLDRESFAVLGRLSDRDEIAPWIGHVGAGLDGLRVRFGQTDPTRERLRPVPGARTITTAGGLRGLICITADGHVFAKAGLGWREIATGTDLLVPGR